MMRVAIIPARGGSKRIPRKNIRPFFGQPVIAYPIQAALQSGAVDKVVVSTDDPEIAAIARQFGAETPFMRKAELADDFTGTMDVIRNAITELQQLGWPLSSCACIYAPTPLLSSQNILAAYTLLQDTGADYVFTAAKFSFPIQRALLQTSQGGIKPFDPNSIMERSQDLPATFHDAGQLYWAMAETWLDTSKFLFGEGSRMLLLPEHLVQDIDTPEDWYRAELIYKMMRTPEQ